MARVKKEDIHPAYKTMQIKSDSYEETNDCSVVATAIAAGISYDKSRHMYRRAGRMKGKGVNYGMIDSVLSTVGSYRLPFYERLRLIEDKNGGRALTFNNVTKLLDSSKRYIIVGRTHMVACLDGRIADWSEGTRYRVENIYQITEE